MSSLVRVYLYGYGRTKHIAVGDRYPGVAFCGGHFESEATMLAQYRPLRDAGIGQDKTRLPVCKLCDRNAAKAAR